MAIVERLYRLTPVIVRSQQEGMNTHFVRTLEDDAHGPIYDTIEQSWNNICSDAYRAIHPAAYTLSRLDIQLVVQPEAENPPAVHSYDYGVAGTRSGSGDYLAMWLAVSATIRTALAGRRRRGRNSFAGGLEGDIDGNSLSTTAGGWWDKCGDYLATVFTAFADPDVEGTGNGQWVVMSNLLRHAEPNTPAAWREDVTAFTVHQTLRTMKSRVPS